MFLSHTTFYLRELPCYWNALAPAELAMISLKRLSQPIMLDSMAEKLKKASPCFFFVSQLSLGSLKGKVLS